MLWSCILLHSIEHFVCFMVYSYTEENKCGHCARESCNLHRYYAFIATWIILIGPVRSRCTRCKNTNRKIIWMMINIHDRIAWLGTAKSNRAIKSYLSSKSSPLCTTSVHPTCSRAALEHIFRYWGMFFRRSQCTPYAHNYYMDSFYDRPCISHIPSIVLYVWFYLSLMVFMYVHRILCTLLAKDLDNERMTSPMCARCQRLEQLSAATTPLCALMHE